MSIRESFEWVALPVGVAPQPPSDGATPLCRVSVFVAPKVTLVDEAARTLRLEELGELADWPATLAAIDLAIEVDGQPPVAAARVGPPPSSALWRRIFPGTTNVEPFVPDDPTVHTVVQYGAADVAEVIEAGYSDAAPLEPPAVDHFDPEYWAPQQWMPDLDQPPAPGPDPDKVVIVDGTGDRTGGGTDEVILTEVPGTTTGEELQVHSWSIRNLFPPVYEVVTTPDNSWVHGVADGGANLMQNATFVAGQRNAAPIGEGMPLSNNAALQMARFADSLRLAWVPEEEVDLAAVLAAERRAALVASYDLHRIVAALGDHPALLRALGLVIDLQVPIDVPQRGRIRVVVHRPNAVPDPAVDRTPWVAVTSAAPNGFAAPSVTDDVAPAGLEALDRYRVVQLDVEGAGIKLLERATEEATGPAGRTAAGTPGNGGARELPALRTAGLRLVEQGSADRLIDRAERVNTLRANVAANNGDDTLDADDVQRGYRLDVFDEATGHWYPLHARRVRYSGADASLLGPVTDEGSFTGSFTGRPLQPGEHLGAGDIITVDEALVTWDGWSLAAPRPGRVISADPRDADAVHRAENGTEIIGRPANDPLTSTGLRIDTVPLPGSLPRLRFGHTYRMRMRSVDLAGNALTMAQADAAVVQRSAAVTEPVTFRRFERVPPPVPAFAPESAAGPGGAEAPRYGESERRLVVRSGLDAGDDTFTTPDLDERLIFAPECSVALAEWHGLFDDAIAVDAPAAARAEAYRRAGREAGSLTSGATELPWLADPASAGACFSGLPGMAPDEVLTLPWPRSPVGPGPIRLRLVAVDGDVPPPPTVDEAAGQVTAFLPPGGRVTAEVSSVLADERVMALPALWRERLGAEALAVVEARLARHRHAMITPSLPIELVHAAQRPRLTPRPAGPTKVQPREPEQTDVRVIAPWTVHAPTTGAVELEATWTSPRDEPVLATPDGTGGGHWVAGGDAVTTAMGRPVVVPAPAAAGPSTTQVTVGDVPDADAAALGATIDFGTTAHVRLRLRAVATSRFAEFFPPEYGPAPATGDTPARPSRLTVASDEIQVLVPNTRRPPAPTVLEAMPLIVRHRTVGATPADGVVRREGGWLRIWLARPWFVTGWYESPAVVAVHGAQPLRPDEADYRITTLVGPDPARGAPVFDGMRPDALGGFPDAWATLQLADASGEREIVVSDRDIDWDPDRGAWFVDLRMDVPQLYFPFVRIAIARDQPHSISGTVRAHEFRVSPVVTLDPIQVLPDRELRHSVVGNGVRVDLTGRSYDTTFRPVDRGSPDSPAWTMEPLPGGAPSAARIVAQRRVRTGGDELLAWEDVFEQPMEAAPDAPAGTIVARLTLPFDPTNPPGEFRLLVIEEDFAYGPGLLGHPEGTRSRVTFAEVIPLPRAVAAAVG